MRDPQQHANQQIMRSLSDIHEQNQQISQKIDKLEQTITKKATVAGAVAGAITGSLTSGVMTVGIELIKAKFGG